MSAAQVFQDIGYTEASIEALLRIADALERIAARLEREPGARE